jgi:Flp pilus assembly protein TadD
MKGVADLVSQIRSLTLNLLFFVAVAVLIVIVWSEVQARRVSIGPISIPEALKAEGYSEEVIASRLHDAIGAIQTAATTSKERTEVAPASRAIDIVVPEVGISLLSVTQFVRRFLGVVDTTITGELMCSAPTPEPHDSQPTNGPPQTAPTDLKEGECRREWLSLRLRIGSSAPPIDTGAKGELSERAFLAAAAEEVLNRIDPYVVAASYYQTDPDKALALANGLAHENHPDRKWALNLIGNIHLDQKELDLAQAAFGASIAADGNFPLPHNGMGNALYDAGDIEGAIAAYRKAIDLDPNYALPHYGLGIVLANTRDIDGAIAEYRTAIDLDPNYAAPHNGLGTALARQGDVNGAIAAYRAAVDLDPDDARPHVGLGNALARQGNIDGATAAYRTAIDLDPNYAAPHNGLGTALYDAGDIDGAIAEYRKAIALDRDDAAPHINLASVLAKLDDIDGAIAEYRKAIVLDPNDALPHNNLGIALARQGDTDGAIAEYRKAVDLDPEYALAYSNWARVLTNAGRYREALPPALKAADIDPGRTEPVFFLANDAGEAGDSQTARAAAEEYLLRAPDGFYADDATALLDRSIDGEGANRPSSPPDGSD